MAPIAVDTGNASPPNGIQNDVKTSPLSRIREPLSYSGSLDEYESFDVTNIIGKEFPKLQLSEIIHDDAKIRDLAILVSQRGVVFFRNQDLKIEDQKMLGGKLGELTGKPATSKAWPSSLDHWLQLIIDDSSINIRCTIRGEVWQLTSTGNLTMKCPSSTRT